MRSLLQACSPHHHPHRWLFVNGAIILWSAILLIRICNSAESKDADEKSSVEFNYLIYNFGTCIVWLIEVSLNVLDHKGYFDSDGNEDNNPGEESLLQPTQKAERTKREVVALWIEFALAAYFFIDSTTVAVHLTRMQIHRQAKGMTFDICINFAAYGFLVYRQLVDWRASRQNGGQSDISHSVV